MVWYNHKILKSLLLRRTKKERAVDLALPTKTVSSAFTSVVCFNLIRIFLLVTFFGFVQVIVRKDSLDDRENDYYKTLCRRSQEQLDMYAISLVFQFFYYLNVQ